MATMVSCDRCGAAGARQTEVAIVECGAVREGQNSATAFASDLCDACRIEGARELFEKAIVRHMAAIPNLRKIDGLSRQLAALIATKDAAVIMRDENADPAKAADLARAANDALAALAACQSEIARLQME